MQAAAEAFGTGGFGAITMAGLARAVGLAKGTLYLYFRSKEELFVAVLEAELDRWQQELMARLNAAEDLSPEELAIHLADSIAGRPHAVRLLAIMSPVLEANIPEDVAIAFKLRLVGRMAGIAQLVETRCPLLRPGEGVLVVRRLDALVVGLWPMAKPGILADQAVKEPRIAAVRVDFAVELRAMLTALLRGMTVGR